MSHPELSVVVPVFNERDNVAPLVGEIVAALRGHLPQRGQAAADRKASAVDGLGQFVGQPLVAGGDHCALIICIHRVSRHLVLYP